MKSARLIVRACALLGHLLLGVIIVSFGYRFLNPARQRAILLRWFKIVLHICHVQIVVRGEPPAVDQGLMMVANHISWLDIPTLNSVFPLHFVAKSEIRKWPIVGYLCARTGTIFIRRAQRHTVHQVMQFIKELLVQGHQIGVFPEGTTSAGDILLPFHANLLQAAVNSGVPILPIALRYLDAHGPNQGQRSLVPAFIGDMTIITSLRQVLSSTGLVAEVSYLEPIYPQPGQSRHELARKAHAAIALHLNLFKE